MESGRQIPEFRIDCVDLWVELESFGVELESFRLFHVRRLLAIFCFNYSLYKMAALMILWNRFSSYFAKREEDSTRRPEACNEDEKQSCYVEMPPNICTACNKEIPDSYYNSE
jgi:hypothetical protein